MFYGAALDVKRNPDCGTDFSLVDNLAFLFALCEVYPRAAVLLGNRVAVGRSHVPIYFAAPRVVFQRGPYGATFASLHSSRCTVNMHVL